jgi:hypothetical protein
MPLRNRELPEVDIVTDDDVLFDGAGLDDAWRDRLVESLFKVTHDRGVTGAIG